MRVNLYLFSAEYAELFDKFDEIANYEFDTNADGEPIDDNGEVIENPDEYRQFMLEAWFDTLDGMEQEFVTKAENIGCYVKQLKSEADAIEREEKALKKRKEQKRRSIDFLQKHLMDNMKLINMLKIDAPRVNISIRNNPEKVVVDDERKFIRWAEENNDYLLRYSEPEINKTEVKKLLQQGDELPCVHLERTQSLILR